ncbi:hypothetical protein [Sporosarcina aquimarina]|uniref:DUF4265 domain-containing protein n=1 Tax=Sporosarcina aquimarina TaxID=114975 RepID=A0ABU4FXI3_9BACL|nr:hypothetical protein [Sporosarcina aquimarina]MDW0109410.1 hypothetical protein [Sporosarcina aquimarina]
MINYFERKLRFTDLEVWDIQFGEDIYRMFISDERRSTEITDLNLPSNSVDVDLRENLIVVSVYSSVQVKDEHIESIDQFMKQITDHVALAHCDVVLSFYTDSIDDIFEQVIKEKTCTMYEEIPLNKLCHLNQN